MLLEHIVTDQRYYSEYFRVAFYGNFPAATRDKHFIVSGALPSVLEVLLITLYSTGATNGRNWEHFANAC